MLPITAHLMFFTFVILVTVILMNLLVGLAVSDIQGLQASAGLNRLSRQAELVARLEGLLFSKLLKKAPPKLLAFLRREALLRTSRYNLQLGIKPNDPREKTVSHSRVLCLEVRVIFQFSSFPRTSWRRSISLWLSDGIVIRAFDESEMPVTSICSKTRWKRPSSTVALPYTGTTRCVSGLSVTKHQGRTCKNRDH